MRKILILRILRRIRERFATMIMCVLIFFNGCSNIYSISNIYALDVEDKSVKQCKRIRDMS